MKKLICAGLTAILSLLLCIPVLAAPTASLSGPSTVRAGNTITLSFQASGGCEGFEATMQYDSALLTFNGITSKLSSWKAENNGTRLVVYDDAMSSPLNKTTTVFTLSFKVSAQAAAGTKLTVSLINLEADNGSIGSVSYSAVLAAPLSGDATLKSLSVAGVTLSPAFSPSVTSYSATVPFSVSSLSVSALCNDSGASAKVSGASLSVGKNTVTVKVTAANGTTKNYTVSVTREQDPNYQPSDNNRLASLTLSSGQLSPAFDPEVTSYIVYVPFETETFSLSATPENKLASAQTGDTVSLSEGKNTLTAVCRAENGDEKTYTVFVMRMPAFGEEPSQTAVTSETEAPVTAAPTDSAPAATASTGIRPWIAVLTFVLGAAAGCVVLYFIRKKK